MDDISTPRRSQVKSRRRAVLALLAIVLLVAVLTGVRWWASPKVFGGGFDTFASRVRPVENGSLTVGITLPATKRSDGRGELTLRSITPELEGSRADVEVLVCHLAPADDPIIVADDPEDYCSDLEPFRAGMRFTQGWFDGRVRDQLYVTIVPREPGTVRLHAVDVDYALGREHHWQRGTERLTGSVVVRTR